MGHSLSLFLVDFKPRNDVPLFVADGHWETVVDSFRDLIRVVIGPCSEGNPIVVVALEPASHMGNGSVSSRGSAGKSSGSDDLGSSFLDSGNEILGVPILANQIKSRLSFNGSPSQVREHSGRVVSPNNSLGDLSDRSSSLLGNLPEGPIVVQSGHSGKVLLREVLCVSSGDQTVGVGGVSDNKSSDISVSVVVEGLSLRNENLGVFLQQVSSLHSGSSGFGSNQKSSFDVLESNFEIVSADNVSQKREGTISQLHSDSGKSLLSLRDIDKMEDDGLIVSEHVSVGDSEKHGVADLTGGSSNSDSNGLFARREGSHAGS